MGRKTACPVGAVNVGHFRTIPNIWALLPVVRGDGPGYCVVYPALSLVTVWCTPLWTRYEMNHRHHFNSNRVAMDR